MFQGRDVELLVSFILSLALIGAAAIVITTTTGLLWVGVKVLGL